LGISSDKDSLAGIVPGGARFDCCAITSARALVNIWRDDNRRYTVLFGQGQGFRDSQRLECLMPVPDEFIGYLIWRDRCKQD